MSIIRNMALMGLVLFCLAGCDRKPTYSHLMRHPKLLMSEVERCKALEVKTSEEETQCDTTMYAAANFMSMMNTEREDPEKFGQQIMDAEVLCAQAKLELRAAKQNLASLKAGQASAVELKAAQDRLDNAKQGFREHLDNVRILLAVVGVNSPE